MKWGLNNNFLCNLGLDVSINLDTSTHPHALITGSSGSGKSYALMYLLGSLLQSNPDTVLYFLDFKNSEDFRFLKDYEHYYIGNDCHKGIINYYTAFTEVRQIGKPNKRYLLICDEYPALLNYLQIKDKQDKTKLSNDVLSAVAEILMMGRGLNFGIWIVTQRADSSWFSNGARDNFMVTLCLGRISKEQKNMLFSGEEIPDTVYKKGEGLLLADGYSLKEVKIPRIGDMNDWNWHILKIINRNCGA